MAAGKRPIAGDPSTWPRFEFKTGNAGFKFGGMKLEGDPSSIPVKNLRYLINGRLVDGVIQDRAGFANYDASPVGDADNCVFALTSIDPTRTRLFLSVNGCPGSNGGSFQFYDPENYPERQTYASYPDAAAFEPMLGRYGDEIFIGVKSRLYRSRMPDAEYGISTGVGSVSDSLIHDFGTGLQINFVQAFNGSLFVGVEDLAAPGSSKIWSWDGKTWLAELTGINAPRAAVLWREFLVVGTSLASNNIRIRTLTGTWSTVAPGAGNVATYRSVDAMISWQDAVYIADGTGGGIWKYNGVNLTLLRNPAAATKVIGFCDLEGILFYLYNTAASCRVGKYDGTTFTDVTKNITTQFPNDSIGGGIASYRGQVIVGMAGSVLVASPGLNSAGTWLGTGSTSPATANICSNLVVI